MTRGSGLTTAQMKSLPTNGLFVWCNNAIAYPKQLAEDIGRRDIKVVRPCWIMGQNWRGQRFPAVVVDHAYHRHNHYNEIFEIYIREIASKGTKK